MDSRVNIRTKKQNYRLWQSGAFGNKLRAWRTIEEWKASGFREPIALRMLSGAGGACWYGIAHKEVENAIQRWLDMGVAIDSIMFNEMAPDNAIVLQGEFFNGAYPDGHRDAFFHSTLPASMRWALASGMPFRRITYGLQSKLLVQSAMTPASFDDWQLLLEQYPDHVLEVSIYDRCLGDCPNRNALVWEVRRY